ncbi:unnamed protein product [Gadus morhua 'NCC']
MVSALSRVPSSEPPLEASGPDGWTLSSAPHPPVIRMYVTPGPGSGLVLAFQAEMCTGTDPVNSLSSVVPKARCVGGIMGNAAAVFVAPEKAAVYPDCDAAEMCLRRNEMGNKLKTR